MTAPNSRPQPVQGDLQNLPAALAPLVALPNWVLWNYEFKEGKWTKVPYQPSGGGAKSNDPQTWSSYAAVIAARNDYDGIGFVLDGEIAAFDLDDCRNPANGLINPWAKDLIDRAGSYTEVTVSGEGLRIIGLAQGPKVHTGDKPIDDVMKCAIYRRPGGRYITISGNPLPQSPQQLVNIDAVINAVAAELSAPNDHPSEEEHAKASAGTPELPPSLVVRLHIPNTGTGEPHGGYASRSELMFAFITDALRARVSGKMIAVACLDPTYRGCAIFEHCRQNRGRPYVIEQIKHARLKLNEGLDAKVADINKDYAVVLAGNKAAVMKFERDQFRLLQIDSFKNFFANRTYRIGNKAIPIASHWMRHKDRRQYEGIEFAPGGGRDGYYNLWRGFAVEPRQGDCSKVLGHLKDNVAQGNDANYRWILGWFAQLVQQPHIKMGTALCLRGKQGVGKTKVGEVFGSLLGNHYELVSDPRYITGQFNSHMAQLVLLHADEAFWAGDKSRRQAERFGYRAQASIRVQGRRSDSREQSHPVVRDRQSGMAGACWFRRTPFRRIRRGRKEDKEQ